MKLLLASKSAARRRMLEAAGIMFETVEAPLDEEEVKQSLVGMSGTSQAEALGEAKAGSVQVGPEALVLGSDQTLEREDGSLLSKPRSREEALDQLGSLSGRTHRLHSAAAIVEAGKTVWRARETVTLSMRPLSDEFLQTYLDQEYEAIRWSVGGYRIEGLGVQLFDRIEGSHFAILGMPLLPLLTYLRERRLIRS